jgi:alpha-tubulin suppressor-like RCC1 family protein
VRTGKIFRLYVLVATTIAANGLSLAFAQTSPITGWGRNDFGQSSPPASPTEVVAIGAGVYHSVGLNRDGTIFAWGYDNYTQLEFPPTLSGVTAIAAGNYHTLALRTNGTVVAWGRNNSNQTNVPSGLISVIAISAGGSHNLVLKTNGLVTAWGSGTQTNVPLSLSNVVAIAAGGSHSLALRADGIVVAWGNNSSNQTNVPATLSNVVAIAAGGSHSLALKDDGTLVAWGSGTATNVPAGLSNMVAIAAGNAHSLALRADGTVISWGSNIYLQTNTPSGLSGVVALAAGYGDSLALTGNGAPWFGPAVPYRQVLGGSSVSLSVAVTGEVPLALQWQCNGTNLPGRTNLFLTLTNVTMAQAGNYRLTATNVWGGAVSADMALTPLPFRFLTQPQPQTALLRGDANFSASLDGQGPFTNQWLFNGTPLPFGTNAMLALIGVQWTNAGLYSVRVSNCHGTLTSAAAALGVTPVAAWGYNGGGQTNVPAGLSNLVLVAAGTSHALALKRDGTVVAWGKYEYGQNPVQQPAGLTNVVGVAAGNSFSLALKNNGTVVAWSDYGASATNLPAGLTNVVAIAAGYNQAMALRADGSVVTWGNPVPQPEGLGPVVQIASGGSHFLAVRAEGSVVAWGDNSYGQTNVPAGLTNVIGVAGSMYHSIAAKADGTVIAWGSNASGQTNVPATATNIYSVSAGGIHSAARTGCGAVVMWGTANYGITNAPADLRGVTSLSAGSMFTTALVGDGPPWFPPAAARYTGLAGMPAALLASASGGLPMTFQWQWNGTNLPGATNALLAFTNLALNQGGTYRLVASNGSGSATSADVLLATAPMRFHFQPHNQTVVSGQAAALSVSLDGQGPFTYKWFHDGVPVANGTGDTLVFNATTWTDAGEYIAVVTNSFGSVTSATAELRVIPVVAWGDGDYVNTAPRDLTNAIAVAAGGGRVIAARRGGLPAVWDARGDGGWLTNFPAAATNTVAVAAGIYHFLALQTNGTVLGWADPIYGGSEATPPADLTNAVAIAAGGNHSLALRADGHIVAFGSDYWGQSRFPTNLDNVVAIADGGFHSLALRADGSVAAWGLSDSGQANVPADLTDAIAIAAGDDQSLALRADGSVTIWGYNGIGATNLPSGLSNLVAVAGGYVHDLALRADGRLVIWGLNTSGQTNVPEWVGSNFVALACGSYHNVALEGNGPPFLAPMVQSRSGQSGGTIYFFAPAIGLRPLRYQWFFNGTAVAGETNALLCLRNFNPHRAGNYSLLVTNVLGTATATNLSVRFNGFWLGAEPGTNSAQFNLGVYGETNSRCSLMVSTNLANWAELQALTNNGQIQIVTENTTGPTKRFYRLLIPTNAP